MTRLPSRRLFFILFPAPFLHLRFSSKQTPEFSPQIVVSDSASWAALGKGWFRSCRAGIDLENKRSEFSIQSHIHAE
jgi:hypothetical protein